ncbi:metallophosphoesterase family protein [Chloroflexota bacterium]
MNKVIVHLSDLHYRQGWVEEQGVVLNGFFKDLGDQLAKINNADYYLVFSGDIVQSGDDSNSYDEFIRVFDNKLTELGIPTSNRICVPGNHDVSTEMVNLNKVTHEGVISQRLDETGFNDYISDPSNILTSKFQKYSKFEQAFAEYGLSCPTITGTGWTIDDSIGIYCLNTALCSIGSLAKVDEVHPDRGRLAIDTRKLHAWNQECKCIVKILVMHHPLDWLNSWAKQELETILRKDFALCLSGHAHDQYVFHSINKHTSLVQCSAPPLFTKKTGELGYSFINISPEIGVIDITYRQWTKHQSFVAGGSFSDSDDGRVIIKIYEESFIDRLLTKRLEDALVSFAYQPKVWVEPVLAKRPEYVHTRDSGDDSNIEISDLVSKPRSTIVKAPPQFGLTCLAHYLIKKAWQDQDSKFWLYLDSKYMKPNYPDVKKYMESELKIFDCKVQDIKCVILDSWNDHKKTSLTLLQNVIKISGDVPIIVMQATDDITFADESCQTLQGREFDILYLWALTRGNVRKVVTDYNEKKHIGDDNLVVSRVVSDLEMLNLHRTPLNCLTLLKVSEIDFDESPVNRTEMLKRVLFLIFNTEIPTYKSRPDLKDCEYVLGYFCEIMLRKSQYYFTRDDFLNVLGQFCKDRVIDLEVEVLFDMLYGNNILVDHGNIFNFRFAYWIYYFAAHRMYHDKDFADFIFKDMRYANYPEMIEFYTGIDRRREDALNVLIKDIQICRKKVQEKSGLPDELNPYRFAQWKPSVKTLERMHSEISDGVKDSKLPDSVKDQYADRRYEPARPYYQEVRNIFNEYSLLILMQAVRAASRALRNSDYVSPDMKRKLFDEIGGAWKQILKVLVALTPLLATEKSAAFDGANFLLLGNFGDTPEKRFGNILGELPNNVVTWFKDDLFSHKMGPLLIERSNIENDDLKKHNILLLLIKQRPRDWVTQVRAYIESISKNSFYLMDVYVRLCIEYKYSFVSPDTLREIKYLIKTAAAKQSFGSIGGKSINKVPDKVLPERLVD